MSWKDCTLIEFQLFSFLRFFFHRHWRFSGQKTKGQNRDWFHSITATCWQKFRHLFATLYVRWALGSFNGTALVYQTATWWDLRTSWITIWLIDSWCNICLFTWWFDSRFLMHQFDCENPWIWTHIDYQLCITSEPTKQMC